MGHYAVYTVCLDRVDGGPLPGHFAARLSKTLIEMLRDS